MSDPIWPKIFINLSDLLETHYSEVLEVSDYESGVHFIKFKMAGKFI